MSQPQNPDPAQLGPYFLIAHGQRAKVDQTDLAKRYGQDGRRPADALPAEAIQARLEAVVFMVLSVRRSLAPSAEALAWFPAGRVELVLAQIDRVARTSVELAYHLVRSRARGPPPSARRGYPGMGPGASGGL